MYIGFLSTFNFYTMYKCFQETYSVFLRKNYIILTLVLHNIVLKLMSYDLLILLLY